MLVAKVQVSGVYAKTTWRLDIPAGIVGAQVEIQCTDPRWDSLSKTAVFRGCETKDELDVGELVTIPAEVVAKPGKHVYLGIYGTDAQNNIAIPTLWADLGCVRAAADPSGDASTDPQLPVWAQLWAEVEELKVQREGVFHAVQYKQQTLTEEQMKQARENIGAEKSLPLMEGTDAAAKCAELAFLMSQSQTVEIFLFFTDPHLAHNSGYEEKMRSRLYDLKAYCAAAPASFLVCGGDWIGNSDTREAACFKLGYIDAWMRANFNSCYPVVGNHDTNQQGVDDTGGAWTGILTPEAVRNLWNRERGKNYYAFDGVNTKCYVLDSWAESSLMTDYRWEQIAWLAERLRAEDAANSAIFVHIGFVLNAEGEHVTYSFSDNILALCAAYNSAGTVTLNDVDYDFSQCTGKMRFILSGHIHGDHSEVIEGIPLIATTNLEDGDILTLDLCMADYDNEVLHMVRVGSGESRSFSIKGTVEDNNALPAEYTQVEYIESSGTQYIDTGVTGGTNASYEIRFNTKGKVATNYEQYFAGDADHYVPKLFYSDGNGTVVAQLGSVAKSGMWLLGWPVANTDTHTIRYEGTEGKVYLDDVEPSLGGYKPSVTYIGNGWGDLSWYVFNSHGEPELMASMQLFHLKMYSDGALVRDFVPAVRNKDGVAGLYDKVTQSFFTNAGAGEFIVPDTVDVAQLQWNAVLASIDAGTYATDYAIGDTVPLDLGSEGVVNMQIAAFDADDLADGSGKAPITWISKELLATSHRMNPSREGSTGAYTEGTGTIGGWEKSEMRSYLIETIKPLISESVRSAIKAVTKTHTARDTAGTSFSQTTTDEVWLPDYNEMFGSSRPYKALFPDDASRIKMKVGATSASSWWLRSACGTNYFYRVYTSGINYASYGADASCGVALCFCT